jgi:pimeloyl-ACP methyl ester carboxylesterase
MSRSEELGERREVTLPQGTIRYRERGSGEPIVFVHGLLVNGDLWRKVVPSLAQDFRCITPDWPLGGHEPPLAANADLTPPGMARLIDGFMAKLDLRDVTLVGNDTGGAFSQLVAVEHPERLARLVLTPCDSYDNFLPAMFKDLQVGARLPGGTWVLAQTLRIRPAHRLPMMFGWLAKRPVERDVMDSYLGPVKRDRGVRRDVGKVLRGISKRYTLDAGERLRDFRRPTLIVWAREDRVFPFEHGERLAKTIPNARLEAVEDSYSFVPEDQPQRLAQLIAEFVGSAAPAAVAQRR